MPTKHLNIWFNRNYATTYWTIKDIKTRAIDDGYTVSIFVTHTKEGSPVLLAADHASAELDVSELSDADYVPWCLAYCAENDINVLVPVGRQAVIMERAQEFADIGVALVASDFESIELFEDKAVAYNFAHENGIPTPPFAVANSSISFAEAVSELRKTVPENIPLVVKPINGVGGRGFYIIGDRRFNINGLIDGGELYASYDEIFDAYVKSEEDGKILSELMVMPFLKSPEISIDCLTTSDGELLRATPRSKSSVRSEFSVGYSDIISYTEKLAAAANLSFVFNAQWRWYEGLPVLLEVNTRASGGLFAVTEHTGENYVWLAILLALGHVVEPVLDSLIESAYITIPTMLNV